VSTEPAGRWGWAEVDLGAIADNVDVLRRTVAPADVWAIVKADGYGHGSVDVARAALSAGVAGLGVALVEEGVTLREAGIDAPILVLSEQPQHQIADLVAHRLTPSVYTEPYVRALARAAAAASVDLPVHVKVDTGMQRVGVAPDQVVALLATINGLSPSLHVEGLFTHLAVADEPDHPGTAQQLVVFDRTLDEVERGTGLPAAIHAANSAGALAHPAARHSFVRAGIAIYGISPGSGVDHLTTELRPALSLRAKVSLVKPVVAGSHVSYGWRHRFERDTTVATVPLGYADGVPRRLGTLPDLAGADVLIGGRRCPIVGVVTMDQFVVDVGGADVQVGDDVVLIGTQGTERIRAEEWADRLDTIGYEIVCGISERVPRLFVGERPVGDGG
jgi:alanine racemase